MEQSASSTCRQPLAPTRWTLSTEELLYLADESLNRCSVLAVCRLSLSVRQRSIARILFWEYNCPPSRGTPSNFIVKLTMLTVEIFSLRTFQLSVTLRNPNSAIQSVFKKKGNTLRRKTKTNRFDNCFEGTYANITHLVCYVTHMDLYW